MSCIKPIKIPNRKVFFNFGFDKKFIEVPCGKCESCLKDITNGFYVRAKFQALETLGLDYNYNKVADPGFILFPTLTYRPKMRPRKQVEVNGKTFWIEGFNYKHIKRWVNQIQDRIHDVYDLPRSTSTMKYLVCSEYGYNEVYTDRKGRKKRGQNAPHYHALLFFPFYCAPDKEYWADYALKMWKLGNANYSDKGAFVGMNNSKSIKYVVEYCCKQHDFYRIPAISSYIFQDVEGFTYKKVDELAQLSPKDLRAYYKSCNMNAEKITARIAELRDILPNHWQSRFFGMSAVDFLQKLSIKERVKFVTDGITFKDDKNERGQLNVYKLPAYITQKLYVNILKYKDDIFCADCTQYKRFNDLYLKDVTYKFDRSINEQEFSISHKLTYLHLNQYMHLDVEKYSGHAFKDINALYDACQDLRAKYGLRYLSAYGFLKNVGFDVFDVESVKQISLLQGEDFVEFVRCWIQDASSVDSLIPSTKGMESFAKVHKDVQPCFSRNDIDLVFKVIQRLESITSRNRYLKFIKEKNDKLAVKRGIYKP